MDNTHINESILNKEILENQKKNRIDHMKYLPGMEVMETDIFDQVMEAMNNYDYQQYTPSDVLHAIEKDKRLPEDFQALLSPAAVPFLEKSHKKHRKKPGNTLETASICSLLFTWQITAKTIVFTADLTVIIPLTGQG